jgi:multiple sugar transport system permease protein
MKSNKLVKRLVIAVLYTCIIAFILVPIFFMVLTTTRYENEVAVRPFTVLPRSQFTLINWLFISGAITELPAELGYRWTRPGSHLDIQSTLINSITVSSLTVMLTLTSSSLAAYQLARGKRTAGKESVYISLLILKMIPTVIMLLPLYLIFRQLGLLDTYSSLVLSYSALQIPVSIWILRGFIEKIPKEVEESALLDGASKLSIYTRIIIPLITPALGAVAVYSFLGAFGEFLYATTFTSRIARTFTVTISEFAREDNMTYTILCTVGTISIIPGTLFAILFNKLLIRGLTAGAVKG